MPTDFVKRYNIVLEQGEAMKPFYELPESERKEIAERLFREVTELYAKFGLKPITGEVPSEKSDGADMR
ncbi:MAG TPA: hypothetical protein VFE50_24570 [Cyclobacteriaceae bacterium]|nr:hypothetical protein [Cyclobacteriaceae bacterium]